MSRARRIESKPITSNLEAGDESGMSVDQGRQEQEDQISLDAIGNIVQEFGRI